MKQRTISAIILLLILVGSLIINVKLFNLAIVIAAIMGFNEIFNIKYKNKEYLIIRCIAIINLVILLLNNTFYKLDIGIIMAFLILSLTIPIIFYKDNKVYNIVDSLYVLGIVLFLGLAFGNIIFLSNDNLALCIFIFIISFISDTYAYIGGSLIGRHKFTEISPKKTIEGVVIGTLMGTLIGGMYYYNIITGLTIAQTLVLCLFLTILSEMGDLLFSSIKRNYGIKDFSNLIPGHGGILDRFDSILYVSLGLYLVMSIL